jgi:hypothetical protein
MSLIPLTISISAYKSPSLQSLKFRLYIVNLFYVVSDILTVAVGGFPVQNVFKVFSTVSTILIALEVNSSDTIAP